MTVSLRARASLGLLAVVALVLALLAVTASPSRAAADRPARPAITCVTSSEYFQNGTERDAYYNGTDLVLANSASFICSNVKTLYHGELSLVGLNNMCLTKSGQPAGSVGKIVALTCAGKASQLWTWANSVTLYNQYDGGYYCLNDPRLGAIAGMEPCDANNPNQQWAFFLR